MKDPAMGSAQLLPALPALPCSCGFPCKDQTPQPGWEWCQQCWARCPQPAAGEARGPPTAKFLEPIMAKNTSEG